MKKLIALALLVASTQAVANTTETVFTLADDLRTATKYFSKRAESNGTYRFLFNRNYDKTLINYARPDNYSWEATEIKKQKYAALRFHDTSSYAFLERLPDAKDFLEKDRKNPNLYYLIVDGSDCVGENCLQDESIISTIIPKRFKVINYRAKVDGNLLEFKEGNWKIVDNTYTFYRAYLKGATLYFALEDAANYGYTQISKSFSQNREIEVSNEGNRIRIVMPLERLFDSGSASMQKAGLDWINTLAQTVTDFPYLELRVEGHTDSTPIAKKTQQGFSSNWDLSAARAANIAQYLVQKGLPANRIAAVGYADAHPISNNETPEGRAKNRRIEFSIITREEQPEASASATDLPEPVAPAPNKIVMPQAPAPALAANVAPPAPTTPPENHPTPAVAAQGVVVTPMPDAPLPMAEPAPEKPLSAGLTPQ